jgi:hypothetical protein
MSRDNFIYAAIVLASFALVGFVGYEIRPVKLMSEDEMAEMVVYCEHKKLGTEFYIDHKTREQHARCTLPRR